MASVTSLRNAAKRAPEYNTPDLSGDRVSDAWIRDNLRNVRTHRGHAGDKVFRNGPEAFTTHRLAETNPRA